MTSSLISKMPLSTVFLILLIANCTIAQYLVLNIFSSSDCSGTSFGYIAYTTGCTAFASGYSQLYSCFGSNYTIKLCTNPNCTQNCAGSNYSTACSATGLGTYVTAYCGAPPNLSGSTLNTVVYTNPNCTGSIHDISKTILNSCFLYLNGSAEATCNSTHATSAIYSDTSCTQLTSITYNTIGCTYGGSYSCYNVPASSHTSNTSHISSHTSHSSKKSNTSFIKSSSFVLLVLGLLFILFINI